MLVILNLLLILWATKVLAPLKDIFYKEKKTDILIIEPLKEDIKEKPDEIELFFLLLINFFTTIYIYVIL